MARQLNFDSESGWSHVERVPAQFKPELQLCWRGLLISISEGCMSRKQAIDMLRQWDREDNVVPLDDYRRPEPPDLAA